VADITDELRLSSERVGKIYPILLDKNGKVIDGHHRLAADKNWPKMRINSIESEKQRLEARIVSNICRRVVSPAEKQRLIEELAEICVSEGTKRGQIAQKIATETGLTYRWVMKYLPERYKERPGCGGPSNALGVSRNKDCWNKLEAGNRSIIGYGELFSQPKEKVVKVKSYSNTTFVNLAVERKFFERIETGARCLNSSPEMLISSALSAMINRIERLVGTSGQKKVNSSSNPTSRHSEPPEQTEMAMKRGLRKVSA
jgi:hypothetical protein